MPRTRICILQLDSVRGSMFIITVLTSSLVMSFIKLPITNYIVLSTQGLVRQFLRKSTWPLRTMIGD